MDIKTIKRVNILYVGFILTSGLSLILSILLFTSVADSRLSWLILMGIALALELGKIVTINDKKRLIACLLISVSILGSAGGLNRALTVADDSLSQNQQQRAGLQAQINQTLQAIDQNNNTIAQNSRSIERYIDLDRIRTDARPLQAENRELQQEQNRLQAQLSNLHANLNSVEQSDLPELTAVLVLLATFLALPLHWVQSAVILLLACLLDALTVTFIRDGVLDRLATDKDDNPGPEAKYPVPEPEQAVTEISQEPAKFIQPAIQQPDTTNITDIDNSYPAFKRAMMARRERGEGVLSQRACIRELNLKDRQVRGFFQRLQDEGIIEKSGIVFEWKKANENRQLML